MHNLAHQLTALPFNLFMSWQHLAIVKTKVFCDSNVAEVHGEKRHSVSISCAALCQECVLILYCVQIGIVNLHGKVCFFSPIRFSTQHKDCLCCVLLLWGSSNKSNPCEPRRKDVKFDGLSICGTNNKTLYVLTWHILMGPTCNFNLYAL